MVVDPEPSERLSFTRFLERYLTRIRQGAERRAVAERPELGIHATELMDDAMLSLYERFRNGETTLEDARIEAILRNSVVNHVRRGQALKRGGGMVQVELPDLEEVPGVDGLLIEDLRAAMEVLEDQQPLQFDVLTRYFYDGQRATAIAEEMDVHVRTVFRQLEAAKAFIRELMDGDG